MGIYKLGAECCNNCIHWDAERDEKHGKGNVFSFKNYAKCTCSHSPQNGRNTLAEKVCPYFSHVWGISKTFSLSEDRDAPMTSGGVTNASGMDSLTSAYIEGLLVDANRSVTIDPVQHPSVSHEPSQSCEAPEDNFNGEAEDQFADAMKEQGQANERRFELVKEGMDIKCMYTEKAIDFMHMLDRAKAGKAEDQFAFAEALRKGVHGARGVENVGSEELLLQQKWYRKAAEQGIAEAQYRMGSCGCDGKAASIDWLERASRQGHAGAEKELSSLRSELIGKSVDFLTDCLDIVADDVDEAILCITSAAKELKQEWGETIPLYRLDGSFVDKFVERIEQVAKSGSPELQNCLGKMYASYSSYAHIVEQDNVKAVHWFECAAKSGCSDAMDNLGNCYAKGDGVDMNDKVAVLWYQKAAEAGLDWGQYHLAIKILKGEGADKNIEIARSWLRKAADQGLKKAQERLESLDDECSASNDPASALQAGWKLYWNRSYGDAFRFFQQAEKHGMLEAKYALAMCYYFGKGVATDEKRAIELFKSVAMKWFVSTKGDYKDSDGDYNNYGTACRFVAEDWEGKDEPEKAAKWFRFAARSGSYEAAKSLGYDYWKGTNGFDVDLQKAVYWLQIADWLDEHDDGYLDDYLKKAEDRLGEDCDGLEELEDEDVFIDGCNGDPESQYQIGCWMFNGEQSFCEDVCAAMAWWHRAAMQGHVQAQLKIADKLFTGCADVEKDEKEAFKWYLIAAKSGRDEALFKVGYAYYFGEGVEENEPEAFKWFKRAAEAGNRDAMCRLGECYFYGRGVEVDHAVGVEWYKKAAEKGVGLAQVKLGLMFYRGNDTVEKDLSRAFKWFASAAEKRADAKAYLGECYENGYGVTEDAERAGILYKKAADASNPNGWYNYARCLEDGLCGIEQSLSEALSYYKKAAEKGVAEACYRIGNFYNYGWSVDKDKHAAFEWYLKAAEKGVPDAQDWVGAFYRDGRGDVEKDCAKGLEWFLKAAKQGYAQAQYNAANCYLNGDGCDEDDAEALKWFLKSAAQGKASAQNMVGRCHENGWGCDKDTVKALEWYRKASDNGSERSMYHLGRLYENGIGVEVDKAKAKEWYQKAADKGEKDANDALERIG